MQPALKRKLGELTTSPVKWDCPLAGYTSFMIGGPADAIVVVEQEEELSLLVSFLQEEEVDWCVIGKGTNLLVSDDGFCGVVIVLGRGFQEIDFSYVGENIALTVGGATGLSKLSQQCVEKGLSGLEFASGIPGTVGGAVIMNAGAWGSEMSDVITSVEAITASGKKSYKEKELNFGYRCWNNHVQSKELMVVTKIGMRLSKGDRNSMVEACSDYRKKRFQSQPQRVANAGSVFKNPPGDSAGRLIEASGLKGFQVGGATVSTVHANFIVNKGEATAADVRELMETITNKVKTDSNIELVPEIHFI